MNCKSTSCIVLHHKYSRTLVYFSSHQEEQKRTGCGRRHRRELDAGEGHSKVEELVCTHVLWICGRYALCVCGLLAQQ